MSASEAEIREALRLRVELYKESDNPLDELRMAVDGLAAFLQGPGLNLHYPGPVPNDPEDSDPTDVWMNLRPTEIKVLDAIADAAVEQAIEAAHAAIVEVLVAAGLRFAAEYPDAPRAKSKAGKAA